MVHQFIGKYFLISKNSPNAAAEINHTTCQDRDKDYNSPLSDDYFTDPSVQPINMQPSINRTVRARSLLGIHSIIDLHAFLDNKDH